MIELQHLTKQYGEQVAVRDLSLTVGEGELLVLLGGSGSGKTTTLKMITIEGRWWWWFRILSISIWFLTRMYARFGAMAGPPCSDRGCGCNSLLSGSHRLYE